MASTASIPIGAIPLATYWCSRYPVRPSSYLLVIIVFVAIQANLEYQVIFEVDLEGQGRSIASTASIPIGASTSGHVLVQSVSRQTLQLFVGNNRFRCYIHQFGIMGYIRGGFRRSRTIDGEYCKYSHRSQYLWPRTGVVGIPSDPPVICW